jgi:hypothetical protein
MNVVKMPRSNWDTVVLVLEEMNNALTDAIVDEINEQLDQQEH